MEDYKIRNMTKDEVESIAISWAAKEGWNSGLHDAAALFAVDPKGFFVGEKNGKPIACISAVSHNPDFGFIGFYIVIPEERGKGYGLKLWNRAMQHFTSENIGLDGVVSQQANYIKSGFKPTVRNIRYEGFSKRNETLNKDIVDFKEPLFTQILAYDKQIFPASRKAFLKEWFKIPGSFTKIYIEKEKVKGYGTIRPCQTGYKIGPLFADDPEIAKDIFNSLIGSVPNRSQFYLDVPEVNKLAIEVVNSLGLKYVFETSRMLTKEKVFFDYQRTFGLTTLEVG